jgi:hypothetical protein
LLQGKVQAAWAIAREEQTDDLWPLLEAVASWKHGAYGLTLLDAAKRLGASDVATAVALLSAAKGTLPEEHPLVEPSQCYTESIAKWNGLLGRRARRIYSIPPECLAWNTERGTTRQSSEQDLLLGIEEALAGAPWWEGLRAAAVSQGDADEAKMLLYTGAFPDDIPDEWSLEERAKSHGPVYSNPSKERFWRNMLGPTPTASLLWNPTFFRPPPLASPKAIWNFTPVKHCIFHVLPDATVSVPQTAA